MFRNNRLGVVLMIVTGLLIAAIIVILGAAVIRNVQRADNLQQQVDELNAQQRGPRGDDGLSAYQIAVREGFVGTETEWLASLVGPAGKNGTNGTNGTSSKSSTGPAGPAGASVVAVKCFGTYIAFYNSTGADIGHIQQVCIR